MIETDDRPPTLAGKTAREWAEQALGEIIDGDDAICSLSCAMQALRIEYGETTEGADSEDELPCTCPPDLRARGGWTSTCLACH